MRSVWEAGRAGGSVLRSLPSLVTSLPCYHDCFVTTWQFSFETLSFGDKALGPISFFPGMFPRCPWTAIVVADYRREGNDGDGIYVHLTLPSQAMDLLRKDPGLNSHMDRAAIV